MSLPESYVRPSLEDFIAAGYPAPAYVPFFKEHEHQLEADYARKNPEPAVEPVVVEPPAFTLDATGLIVETPAPVAELVVDARDTEPPPAASTVPEIHREDFESPDAMLAAIEGEIVPADVKERLRAAAYDWALELSRQNTDESEGANTATSAPSESA